MKKWVLFSLLAGWLFSSAAFAQPQDVSGAVKAKMQQLRWIEGTWTGQASYNRGGKEQAVTVQMTETASFLLDGMILTFEGIGRQGEEVKHHTYAMITWDNQKGDYVMLAMTEDGHMAMPAFKANEQGLVWGMKLGPNQVKYTIENQGGTWHETGKMSRDGETWEPFFEMTLTRE